MTKIRLSHLLSSCVGGEWRSEGQLVAVGCVAVYLASRFRHLHFAS
jgi:hypothetical protein